jgi:hypothetical protein
LIARISAATITIERTPPRLSTGSEVSLTCAGTSRIAITSAITANGSVIRNTEPHEWCRSTAPDSSGPSADIEAPIPDHSAIGFVRAGPDHSAVINASVVGKAIPAASPPKMRAPTSTPTLDAVAARIAAGIDSAVPSTSISLRP